MATRGMGTLEEALEQERALGSRRDFNKRSPRGRAAGFTKNPTLDSPTATPSGRSAQQQLAQERNQRDDRAADLATVTGQSTGQSQIRNKGLAPSLEGPGTVGHAFTNPAKFRQDIAANQGVIDKSVLSPDNFSENRLNIVGLPDEFDAQGRFRRPNPENIDPATGVDPNFSPNSHAAMQQYNAFDRMGREREIRESQYARNTRRSGLMDAARSGDPIREKAAREALEKLDTLETGLQRSQQADTADTEQATIAADATTEAAGIKADGTRDSKALDSELKLEAARVANYDRIADARYRTDNQGDDGEELNNRNRELRQAADRRINATYASDGRSILGDPSIALDPNEQGNLMMLSDVQETLSKAVGDNDWWWSGPGAGANNLQDVLENIAGMGTGVFDKTDTMFRTSDGSAIDIPPEDIPPAMRKFIQDLYKGGNPAVERMLASMLPQGPRSVASWRAQLSGPDKKK